MKAFLFAAVSLLISATVSAAPPPPHGHLKFAGGAIHAHIFMEQMPNDKDEAKMRLEWHDGATHAFIEPGQFEVDLFMPEMGHGSSPTQITHSVDAKGQAETGVYEVSSMYFIMSGDWEVRVTLKSANGAVETQAWKITIPE